MLCDNPLCGYGVLARLISCLRKLLLDHFSPAKHDTSDFYVVLSGFDLKKMVQEKKIDRRHLQ